MYCSNACKLRVWKTKNPDAVKALRAKDVRKVSAYFTGYCACGLALGGRTAQTACSSCARTRELAKGREAALGLALAKHRQDAKVIECDECQCQFCPVYGSSNATLCVPCKAARQRAGKSMHRALYKARCRAATIEMVDPFDVFERCRLDV